MRIQYRVISEGKSGPVREVEAETVRLGRDGSCEIAFDGTKYAMVSGRHARIEPAGRGSRLVRTSETNPTLLNDSPIDAALIKAGDRVRLGRSGPTIEIMDIGAGEGPPIFDQTEHADDVARALLRDSARIDRFELGPGGVLGRDPATADFVLDHPHVSKRHAQIMRTDDNHAVLIDLGSSNGTYVNGQKVARALTLGPGDRIDIGPYRLRFDGHALVGQSRAENVELAAIDLVRVVKDRATRQPLKVLDGVSLVVRPREFVCLLGPSGSGKSTLLAMLSGRKAPDGGSVLINGEDLYANFEAVKKDIAVVAQKDVLHDSLAVGRALQYTAELRLPPDTTKTEVESSIADMLEIVGLTARRATLIRHLSGGQLKRASLANELISRPGLLFLDEVTSGLDEQTDREVMELFRRVADGGKTVICITHSLANVEATSNLVVILATGGRLAFVGTPDEAKAYFGIPRLGEVYRVLGGRKAEEWEAAFRETPYHDRYIVQRRVDRDSLPPPCAPKPTPPLAASVDVVRQAWVLGRRYVSVWMGDRAALGVLLGQAALVAVLLAMVFGDLSAIDQTPAHLTRTINLILLATVSSFWFGCNTAAKEVVKERVIYRRERAINLSVWGYLASKFLVLALIGTVQTTILFIILRAWCGVPGPMAAQWLTLTCLALAGTALGLLISAVARTEEVATALVPIVVMPQIILAGVVAPLSGLALLLAKLFVTAYWGRTTLEHLLPEADQRLLNTQAGSWFGPFALVLLQGAIFAAAGLFAIKKEARQD